MKRKQNIQDFRFGMLVPIFQKLLNTKIIKAFVFAIAFGMTRSHNYNYPERERKIHKADKSL